MRYFMVQFLLLVWIAQAADRDLAGRYAGEWKSNNSGVSGQLRMSLEPSAGGAWYDFTFQSTTLRSRINGTWNGKAFEGHYLTTVVEGGNAVDDGTWSAVRGK